MIDYMASLGPWNWIILGGILLALEVMAPGVYLLWIGIAAILTGTITFQLGEFGFWTWQVQVVVFLALAVASAVLARFAFGSGRNMRSDQPLLNRRAEQLVGRSATLQEPIENGVGRVRLGDTQWRVRGPDLPGGARVQVVGTDGLELAVEPLASDSPDPQ